MRTKAMASVLAQKIVQTLNPSDDWVSSRTAERIAVIVLCEIEAMGWVWPGELARQNAACADATRREMEALGRSARGSDRDDVTLAKLTAEQEKTRDLREIIDDLKEACEYARAAAAGWREIAQAKRGESVQGAAPSPTISVPGGWKLVRDEH